MKNERSPDERAASAFLAGAANRADINSQRLDRARIKALMSL
jgi:hypothetical protein